MYRSISLLPVVALIAVAMFSCCRTKSSRNKPELTHVLTRIQLSYYKVEVSESLAKSYLQVINFKGDTLLSKEVKAKIDIDSLHSVFQNEKKISWNSSPQTISISYLSNAIKDTIRITDEYEMFLPTLNYLLDKYSLYEIVLNGDFNIYTEDSLFHIKFNPTETTTIDSIGLEIGEHTYYSIPSECSYYLSNKTKFADSIKVHFYTKYGSEHIIKISTL